MIVINRLPGRIENVVDTMEHEIEAPSGELEQLIRGLGYVEASEAARIVTLRAARQGDYHLYTPTSINKGVYNKQLQVAAKIAGNNYYRKEDIEAMSIKPRRARRSWTPERLRSEIAEKQEYERVLRGMHKGKLDKETRKTLRELKSSVKSWQEQLPLAEEAEAIVKAFHEEQAQAAARLKEEQDQQEPPPKVASV